MPLNSRITNTSFVHRLALVSVEPGFKLKPTGGKFSSFHTTQTWNKLLQKVLSVLNVTLKPTSSSWQIRITCLSWHTRITCSSWHIRITCSSGMFELPVYAGIYELPVQAGVYKLPVQVGIYELPVQLAYTT